MEQQPYDKEQVALAYGGDWCDCIEKVIDGLSPKKLAVYCIEKGYRPFHEPKEDDLGVRYGYYLTTVKIEKTVGDKEEDRIVTDKSIVAGFGDFNHRPLETIQSVLRAIKTISQHERRTPQMISHDVVKCDEKKAPAIRQAKADIPDAMAQPGTRRYMQTSQGNIRTV